MEARDRISPWHPKLDPDQSARMARLLGYRNQEPNPPSAAGDRNEWVACMEDAIPNLYHNDGPPDHIDPQRVWWYASKTSGPSGTPSNHHQWKKCKVAADELTLVFPAIEAMEWKEWFDENGKIPMLGSPESLLAWLTININPYRGSASADIKKTIGNLGIWHILWPRGEIPVHPAWKGVDFWNDHWRRKYLKPISEPLTKEDPPVYFYRYFRPAIGKPISGSNGSSPAPMLSDAKSAQQAATRSQTLKIRNIFRNQSTIPRKIFKP